MNSESIALALAENDLDNALCWQVIIQESILHIYINYEVDCQLDRDRSIDFVCDTLSGFDDCWSGFWLYSRVLGEVEPDWQIYIDLEVDDVTKEPDCLIENVEELVTEAKKTIEEIKEDSLAISQELMAEEVITEPDNESSVIEPAEDVIDEIKIDTQEDIITNEDKEPLIVEGTKEDVITEPDNESSVIEPAEEDVVDEIEIDTQEDIITNEDKEPLIVEGTKEEVITEPDSESSAIELTKEDVVDEIEIDTQEDIITNEDNKNKVEQPRSESRINLSQYCFIRNQRLLSGELVAPRLKIANLLQSFDELSETDREITASLLHDYFYLERTNDLANYRLEVQTWWLQITELTDGEKRKAAIWLSRYCADTQLTLSEIQVVFDAEAAKQAAMKQVSSKQDNLSVNSSSKLEAQKKHSQHSNYSRSEYLEKDSQPNKPKKSKKYDRLNQIVLISWLLGTILFIVLGISSVRSERIRDRAITPPICEEIIDSYSLDYCKLAVDFVGEEYLTQIQEISTPFSGSWEKQAIDNCEQLANIRAGVPLSDSDPRSTKVLDSYGESILPGIFIAEAEQYSAKEAENPTVRTACLYSIVEDKAFKLPSVKLISADIIPNNWPTEAYEGKTMIRDLQTFNRVLGLYSFLILMGAGTLFTAIGLFTAAVFNLGITIRSLDSVFQSAFILSIVETIFASSKIPLVGGIFIGLALHTIALGITGACVKGLKVHWSDGYKAVALGSLTIITIRSILQYLLIVTIFALIG